MDEKYLHNMRYVRVFSVKESSPLGSLQEVAILSRLAYLDDAGGNGDADSLASFLNIDVRTVGKSLAHLEQLGVIRAGKVWQPPSDWFWTPAWKHKRTDHWRTYYAYWRLHVLKSTSPLSFLAGAMYSYLVQRRFSKSGGKPTNLKAGYMAKVLRCDRHTIGELVASLQKHGMVSGGKVLLNRPYISDHFQPGAGVDDDVLFTGYDDGDEGDAEEPGHVPSMDEIADLSRRFHNRRGQS